MRKIDAALEFQALSKPVQGAIQSIPESKRYLIALSGGLDSVTLLLSAFAFLKSGSASVRAIHVNHGLSPNADRWAEFCLELCEVLGVDCEVEVVEVKTAGEGVESAARKARYQVFEKHLLPGDVLLQGHHQDDQVETLLMRLFKGLHVNLLGSIPQKRALGSGVIFRPFLHIPRSELQVCAENLGWKWVEDESNQDEVYDRNFLRHKVLPAIKLRWPSVMKNLSGMADKISSLVSSQEQWCEHALLQVSRSTGYEARAIDIALLQNFPTLQATLCDIPSLQKITEGYLKQYGIQDRARFEALDMFTEAFPKGDLVLFSQILHDWNREQGKQLLHSAYQALEAAGSVIIHEKLMENQSYQPLANALVTLDMLVWTEGQQYRFEELQEILEQTGFKNIRRIQTMPYWSAVIAEK